MSDRSSIDILKDVLKTIYNETQAIDVHPYPDALDYYWYEVWLRIEDIEKNYTDTTPYDPLADEDDPRTYGLNNGI